MRYSLKNGRLVKTPNTLPVVPWEFNEIVGPTEGVPNEPSPEGEELGAELARLAAGKIARQRELSPESRGPCHDCAFVKGTLPNRCAVTVMDATKAAIEGVPFYCHHGVVGDEPKMLCRGWAATQLQ